MQTLRDFLVECRRRRVFRVAALYVVGAWAILQVADLAFASWGIPVAALRFVWIGAIAGFPVAVFLGWRFDIRGRRIVRVSGGGDEIDLPLQRADYLIIASLATVIIATVFGLGFEISATRDLQPAGLQATAIDPRSIAVLPLPATGIEPDEANFLALGIQDDLLTRLSAIRSLKVISRSSVERYRDSEQSVAAIGRELGVSKLLEGRVQVADGQVRVNVQLIDALRDEHLWAATYDRNLMDGDLFSVQTDIVASIANELQATLTPEESDRLSRLATRSLPAYTDYLKGQQQANLVSIESLNRAIEHYQAAIKLDPEFVLAYAGLADAYLALGSNFYGGLSRDEATALAEPPLNVALALDENVGEAHAALGVLRTLESKFEEAEAAFQRAIDLAPNYSYAYRMYGRLRWQQGQRDEALALAEKALELNPFYAPANFDVARYNDIRGNFDEALTRYLRVIDVQPDYAFAYVYIAAIYYLVHGRPDESLVWYHRAAKSDALSPSLKSSPAIAYLELGDIEAARPWVELGLEQGPETFWSLWASTLLNHASGNQQAMLDDARKLLEDSPRFAFALRFLRDADVANGRAEVARGRYARAFPEFVDSELPTVNLSNYRGAIDFAHVLLLTGEADRAGDLLERSLLVIRELPRLGTNGYWINDARIYALQDRPDMAINALQTAADEGWRVLTWYFLNDDPCLESIRGRPEFERIHASISTDLAIQAANARDMWASDELTAY